VTTAVGHCVFVGIAALCVSQPLAGQADTTTYATFWDHPIHVSSFVGESFPARQWLSSFETGDDGGIGVAWPVTHGSSIWLETQFNGQSQLMRSRIRSALGAVGGGASIYALTVNLVANDPHLLFGRLSPYVVGGGGGYSRSIELDNYAGTGVCLPFVGFCGVYGAPANRTRTENRLGWDLGGGVRVRLSSLWVFAEARYNTASTRYGATTFVPVVLGISW
jgi:opacity protein-like surface antigen